MPKSLDATGVVVVSNTALLSAAAALLSVACTHVRESPMYAIYLSVPLSSGAITNIAYRCSVSSRWARVAVLLVDAVEPGRTKSEDRANASGPSRSNWAWSAMAPARPKTSSK
eukprot:4668949-Pyramimonas_sp.AAC.1